MEPFSAVAGIIVALGGLLVGVNKLVKYLLDFVKDTQERHEAFQAQQHAEWQRFIGNHMSSNTKAMERVADQLEALTRQVNPDKEG